MIAAADPLHRPPDAKLLVVDGEGELTHLPRSRFVDVLRPTDLVIANDAATLPASLHGLHARTGEHVEVRLAAWSTGIAGDVRAFTAVVFGPGDFRTRTEDRPLPPQLRTGDRVVFGSRSLVATIDDVLDHPRLIALRFEGSPSAIWSGLARYGRPIQYAHMPMPLALWDVWTPIAASPVAFEPPSAGFALDWASIGAMHARGITLATVTVAAGISSTGDPDLDGRLPFDEPYRIPEATAAAIRRTRQRGGRVVAVGTTVVRALEHAASRDGRVDAGDGLATQRLGRDSRLVVADAILSGTHEPDSSHYQLLRAFLDDETLAETSCALNARGYRTHEFGDSVFVERRSGTTEVVPCESCGFDDRRRARLQPYRNGRLSADASGVYASAC